jgi:hypothetical protein
LYIRNFSDGNPGTPAIADVICYVIKNFTHNETLELLACGTLSYLAAGAGKYDFLSLFGKFCI